MGFSLYFISFFDYRYCFPYAFLEFLIYIFHSTFHYILFYFRISLLFFALISQRQAIYYALLSQSIDMNILFSGFIDILFDISLSI